MLFEAPRCRTPRDRRRGDNCSQSRQRRGLFGSGSKLSRLRTSGHSQSYIQLKSHIYLDEVIGRSTYPSRK